MSVRLRARGGRWSGQYYHSWIYGAEAPRQRRRDILSLSLSLGVRRMMGYRSQSAACHSFIIHLYPLSFLCLDRRADHPSIHPPVIPSPSVTSISLPSHSSIHPSHHACVLDVLCLLCVRSLSAPPLCVCLCVCGWCESRSLEISLQAPTTSATHPSRLLHVSCVCVFSLAHLGSVDERGQRGGVGSTL